MSPRWKLPLSIVLILTAVALLLRPLDHAPVRAVAASEPNRFSAERAHAHLQHLLAENVPHPSGSEANRIIAERIATILRTAGYEPQVQEGFKCSTLARGCSVVRNIIAIRAGRDPRHAILVTAHYDSVPGSAAAADDGAGIATMLEIAERVARRDPFLHDVVFLFADAEETGLLGAMHFADSHPLMDKVAFVLNMEARGVSGSSVMFETGPDNAALIGEFARAAPNPVSNSLLFEAYRRMPNNTDFTVYKSKQVSGLNFAFVRKASLYHSARDDIQHLDLGSLQHHGDNVYGSLERLANTPVEQLSASTDATYFDIGGFVLLHWPSSWNIGLAICGLALVLVAARRSAHADLRAVGWTVLAVVLLHVLLFAGSWMLSWPLGRWRDLHPFDYPYPWPARIAAIAASVVMTFALARLFVRRLAPGAALTVMWVIAAIEAAAVALMLPGLSYVPLAPLLVYGLAAVIEAGLRRDQPPLVAGTAGFAVAAYMALYHFLMLDALFNFDMLHAKAIALASLMLPLFPLALAYAQRERLRLPIIAGVAIIAVAAMAATLLPTHTIDRPRGINLGYVQEEATGTAYWQLESLGEPGRDAIEAMGFDTTKRPTLRFGVQPADYHRKPANNRRLPPPRIEIEEDTEIDGVRIVRGTVRSARPSFQLGLGLPAASPVAEMRVEDQLVIDDVSDAPRTVRLHGVGMQPMRFELRAQPGRPLTMSIFDIEKLERDEEAQQMLARRPATAAPVQLGDHSIVIDEISL